MDKVDVYQQTRHLLGELQQLLQQHQLWQSELVDPQCLASTAPFCCDVMSFENWLQFMFLPKMHVLVEGRHPLPEQIALLPMGEYSWANRQDIQPLLAILQNIDELLGK